jgi:hypothetical protein
MGPPGWLATVVTIRQGSTLALAIVEPTLVFIFTTLGDPLTAILGASPISYARHRFPPGVIRYDRRDGAGVQDLGEDDYQPRARPRQAPLPSRARRGQTLGESAC